MVVSLPFRDSVRFQWLVSTTPQLIFSFCFRFQLKLLATSISMHKMIYAMIYQEYNTLFSLHFYTTQLRIQVVLYYFATLLYPFH